MPKRWEEKPRLECHRGWDRPATQELAGGGHVEAMESAREAAMPMEDVPMPGCGAEEERRLAAVVMVAVVGTAALEEFAAVEELLVVQEAVAKVAVVNAVTRNSSVDRVRGGPTWSSARTSRM
jgi:hypothetical protein